MEVVHIDYLPPELMAENFRMALPASECFRNLITLSLVSKRWSQMIAGCPCLWTHLDTKQTLTQLKKSLELSRSLPLTVRFRERPGYVAGSLDQDEKSADDNHREALVLTDYADRWTHVTVEVNRG